jgi:hypothetical protein
LFPLVLTLQLHFTSPHAGMAIAFLNDPERQHALAHLRKQMMLSNPQECMLCQSFFDSSADIRCCPW